MTKRPGHVFTFALDDAETPKDAEVERLVTDLARMIISKAEKRDLSHIDVMVTAMELFARFAAAPILTEPDRQRAEAALNELGGAWVKRALELLEFKAPGQGATSQ